MSAVLAAARGAIFGRRLQTAVVGVVSLLSTATAILGLGLLVVSHAPFDRAFAAQAGAHASAIFDPAKADPGAVAATAARPGVTAAAGPFATVTANLEVESSGLRIPAATVAGRAEPAGPVDRLTLDSGGWLTGPGQIVLARHAFPPYEPGRADVAPGDTITVLLDRPVALRLVGIADSITNTADAWVWPSQADVLHSPDAFHMLYRFAHAADAAEVESSLRVATAGLPEGAMVGSASHLAARLQANGTIAPMVPFVVAFAILGLVISVLIAANVVSGAVVAGFRTIGVLKSLGFTPGQVVSIYIGQILAPAAVGGSLGVAVGNAVAVPVLGKAQRAYDVAASAILPPWVWFAAPAAVLVAVGLTAAAAAWRAGRIPAVEAISVGRAPRTGRGYRLRRRLAATRLPRPVSFGLGTLAARPARSAATLLAVVIGAATVVFAAGLSGSLSRAVEMFSRNAAVPVDVELGAPRQGGPDPEAIRAVIHAQPGTAHVSGLWDTSVEVAGVGQPVLATAYDSDAAWTGYELISGRWYAGPGEIVASSRLLGVTGTRVGGSLALATSHGRMTVRVTGETFDNANDGFAVVGGAATLAPLAGDPAVEGFEIGLSGGTDPRAYRRALQGALSGQAVEVSVRLDGGGQRTILLMLSLVATLTVLLTTAAAVGVFNTVVLNTRERVHEIGVLKSIGMTPGQTQAMIVSSMTGLGLIAGLIAIPAGLALHGAILPVMGGAAGTGIPAGLRDVYPPGLLVALGLAGIALAAIGALVPATWAARAHPATALRSE